MNSLRLCNALFSDVNPIAVKKAMNYMDMDSGILREPLITLDNEKSEELEKAIDEFSNYSKGR